MEYDLQGQLLTVFLVSSCTEIGKKEKLFQKSYCDSGMCQAHKPAIHVSEALDVQLQLHVMVSLGCEHVQGDKDGHIGYGMPLQVSVQISLQVSKIADCDCKV